MDWVSKLNSDCHIIYYCIHCHTAPTANNKWYRCTGNPEKLNLPGQFSAKNGHWRCAICLGKHKSADRDYMMFVVGDARNHFVAFMGKNNPQIEKKLTLLKTFNFLAKIGDEVITTSIILKALQELQAESEEKFCCFPMVKKYVTKDPNTVANVFGYQNLPASH